MKDKIHSTVLGYASSVAEANKLTNELCILLGVMPSIILTQTWVEDEEDKSGWIGSGWGEPEGYEIDDVIEEDKYYNETKAIFSYST